LDLKTHTNLSPIWRGFAPGLVNYKKGCTRLAAASDKAYQLLAHGRWFSLGNIAESGIKYQNSIKINHKQSGYNREQYKGDPYTVEFHYL
jgi:hypothetical protein